MIKFILVLLAAVCFLFDAIPALKPQKLAIGWTAFGFFFLTVFLAVLVYPG